ncbi:MAG TPA: hypothetical protein VKT82_05905 [Ktedonobacterales bacterium]|nr:hypothetical protein [Ktedonobacterales bacterium]
MSFYGIALFLHVVGALTLFVAVGLNFLSMLRMRRAEEMSRFREWALLGRQAGRIIPVAILLIAGSALYMVTTAWGWGTAWVDVALGTFLAHGVLVSSIENPRLAALQKAAKRFAIGPVPAAVLAQARHPLLWLCECVVTGTTFGMIFLMSVHPDLVISLVAIGVSLALSLLVALPFCRQEQTAITLPEPIPAERERTLSGTLA